MKEYYRAYAKIDLDAICENIEALKKNTRENTLVTAVIKADGYGHGAIPIAEALEDKVYGFAVATVDEGISLRENGIKNPIIILGFTPENQYVDAIENEIRPAVFEYETAKKMSMAAKSANKVLKIHIKIDTGMSRIGFFPDEETIETIKSIAQLDNLEIEGIFTHFATADESTKDAAYEQFKKFKYVVDRLSEEGVNIKIKHCSNSAAIIDMKDVNMDMVRAGIAMYGLYPSEEVSKDNVVLRPALELKSHVIYIKELEANVPVSYNGTFITSRKTKVATIPVGYGDGYPRNLSSKGHVLINGKRVPIIGRVCMDQFMVDVTDVDGVCEGSEVTLIGRDGEEFISAEEVAKDGLTFNYELVCGLSKRIPRVYIKNNKVCKTKDYFHDIF